MATVVNAFADQRGSLLGQGLGGALGKRQAERRQREAEEELQRLFDDEESTPQDVVTAGRAAGMKPNEAINFGNMKQQAIQRGIDAQAMQDLADNLAGDASPGEAFTSIMQENPNISPSLLGVLSSSPAARDQMEDVTTFTSTGAKATIKIPRDVTGEARQTFIQQHAINKGGAGFSLVDPSGPLTRAKTTERKPTGADIRAGEDVASLVSDVGGDPKNSLHRGRARRYDKGRERFERALDDDFGKPPEQSFTEWQAPQTVRHGLIVAREILKEEMILNGAKNARALATSKAKEEIANGKFLERFGLSETASPKAMGIKMKSLGFAFDEALSIMLESAKQKNASQIVIKTAEEELRKTYGEEHTSGHNSGHED